METFLDRGQTVQINQLKPSGPDNLLAAIQFSLTLR
jgi:hypothetical protein